MGAQKRTPCHELQTPGSQLCLFAYIVAVAVCWSSSSCSAPCGWCRNGIARWCFASAASTPSRARACSSSYRSWTRSPSSWTCGWRRPPITAEQALTRDTVAVGVDAIVFWQVEDARAAAINIANYRQAIERVAQTSLREMIGSTDLSRLLSDRKSADEQLRITIGEKTGSWGVAIRSVEIKDVMIPPGLQDAMSSQAQAEREKQARVTLASAEEAIAEQVLRAAAIYGKNPVALQLRQMNLLV